MSTEPQDRCVSCRKRIWGLSMKDLDGNDYCDECWKVIIDRIDDGGDNPVGGGHDKQ